MILAVMAAACGRPAEAPRPNIVLITIDTLRADRLGCYGYHRETSPFIDTLAARGTTFTNAYATSSWTSPSMASIFTGLYPRQHGVLHGFVEERERRIATQEFLSPRFETLAEVLRDAGYATFGVSSNGHLTELTGFDQGFDRFTSMWFEWSPAPNRVVEGWSAQLHAASPYFLWVHYFDPHHPYFAREPWIGNYTPAGASVAEWAGIPLGRVRARISDLQSDPDALQSLVDLYDSEINHTDDHLRTLFDLLEPGNETLIVLTSDHGEEFLEHDLLGHSKTLFEEVIRVPLIFVLPGEPNPGHAVAQPVSNLNIMATILDYLGIGLPEVSGGTSLMPYIEAGGVSHPRPVFVELDRGREDWKALRLGSWKFMCPDWKRRRCALFDLARDPGERRNLLTENPSSAAQLRDQLFGWIAANPVFRPPSVDMTLDEKQKEKLRSLGYAN
jgi:arylsulfatase A-like enzyme